jgi:hypothetical protein
MLPVLSGQLTIYGRAVSSIIGIPLERLERITLVPPHSLYVADTVAIPAGSQIGRALSPSIDGKLALARWWGFADIDMTPTGNSERGILVEASTNASTLEVLPPAPPDLLSGFREVDAVDTISLTLGAQLAGDPNLRWLLAITGGVVATGGALASVLAIVLPMFWRRPHDTPVK